MTDRPRALAVLIAVFLLGCILGSAGSFLWLRNRVEAQPSVTRNLPPGPGPGRQRLPELLQMTPEQESQFKEIMAESRRRLDALRTEEQPKIEAIRAETNRKLMAILTEPQRNKFVSFVKEMESGRRRPFHGGRGGMEPPR